LLKHTLQESAKMVSYTSIRLLRVKQVFNASGEAVSMPDDVVLFPGYEPPPSFPPEGSLGVIQHTIGSPRFLQLSLHLIF